MKQSTQKDYDELLEEYFKLVKLLEEATEFIQKRSERSEKWS